MFSTVLSLCFSTWALLRLFTLLDHGTDQQCGEQWSSRWITQHDCIQKGKVCRTVFKLGENPFYLSALFLCTSVAIRHRVGWYKPNAKGHTCTTRRLWLYWNPCSWFGFVATASKGMWHRNDCMTGVSPCALMHMTVHKCKHAYRHLYLHANTLRLHGLVCSRGSGCVYMTFNQLSYTFWSKRKENALECLVCCQCSISLDSAVKSI